MRDLKSVPSNLNAVTSNEKCNKPLVSIVVPAYNEAAILEKNLSIIYDYMQSLENLYTWELIIVNDGSKDQTADIAETFAGTRENVRVLHHIINFRLGQALRFAFNNCRGDYVVTMDVDLSYSVDHIGRLLARITETRAKMVIASPYMKGGSASNIPWLRRTLSVWANRFLSFASGGSLSTLTCMVRAYDGRFLKTLNLKGMDVEINAEIIYKAQLLRARIEEIPAHLNWSSEKVGGLTRRSSMRILRSIMSCLLSGFIFRPSIFFMLPGFALMLLSLYPLAWASIHVVRYFENTPPAMVGFDVRLSSAIADAFHLSPHSFLVGGIALMVSFQLITIGFLALQNTKYFEELFHLGTTIHKAGQERDMNESR